jgi:hypothetical protein
MTKEMRTMRDKKALYALALGLVAVACGTVGGGGGSKLETARQTARSGGKTLIILKTSCDWRAGTDANIQVQVNDSNGYTNWVTLDNQGNDRERCDEDYYYVTFPNDAGSVARLRTDSRRAAPSWKLHSVSVYPANPAIPDRKRVWDIWLGDPKHRGTWCEYQDGVAANC